ncbi:calycin-like domain-containing protein [Dysgonomonas termitidis]|uniref:Calycin-like domain-containing protein n=1 Tax=Dysgonomonas termitidis TaxID=1516126 RepID=A0ABV9KUJ5_9BACT
MNKKLLCLLMFVFSLGLTFTACSSDDDDPVNLSLEKSEVNVDQGATVTVKITQGNGDYKVNSASDAIATASVSGDVITLTGVAAGETTITVTDKDKKTTTLKVTVVGLADQVAGTYSGTLSVLGQDSESEITLEKISSDKVKVSLKNFSFSEMELGDIIVSDIPLTLSNGKVILEETSTSLTLTMMGNPIEVDVAVSGTVEEVSMNLAIAVTKVPLLGSIDVTFSGDKK